MANKVFASRPSFNGQPVVLDDDPRLSGGGVSIQTMVDFGHATGGQDTTATVTVPATWVTADSSIICKPAARTTADHGPYDAAVEGLTAYVMNIVPGVSFDIVAYAPLGTWGTYYINAISMDRG